jgi:hypothetical protein
MVAAREPSGMDDDWYLWLAIPVVLFLALAVMSGWIGGKRPPQC